MKIKALIYIVLFSLAWYSCNEELEFQPTERYLKIFDDRSFTADFNPTGVIETQTEGALILTEVNLDNSSFAGSSVIRVDSLGDVKSTFNIQENLVAPVGNFIKIGETHYFASMNEQSLQVHLIPVDVRGVAGEAIPVSGGLRYPLAMSKTSDERILLLSYDPNDQASVISILNTDGTIAQSQSYSVGAGNDIEPQIFNHFTNASSNLTFFVGETEGGLFYFNGFFNFTLSLVFTNFGEDPTGVLQGQQTFTGIRSLLHLSGNDFTLMGFQQDKNYFRPQASLNTGAITSSVDLFVSEIQEIKSFAPAKSIKTTRENGETIVITASETENRQAVIYFHDLNGELLGIELLGSLNPFTFGDITLTQDGSLLVIGTTFLSSRFERIYISKIPAKEIERIIK